MPADLVILGAAVRTLDPAHPRATAVAVADGVIVAVGDDAEVREHAGAGTETVDGRGMALVPGLVDSHIHPFHGTDGTRGADLQGLRTLDEVRGALREERARCAPGEWLLGWGLPYDAFGPGEIGAAAIADATGESPAYLTFFDYHSALVNEPALALAGIDGAREFDAGGAVVVDAGGAPTGELHERPAMDLVGDLVPERTPAQRLDAYAETLRRLNAFGLTGGHVMIGDPAPLRPHRRARGARRADPALRRPAAPGARRHRRGDRAASSPCATAAAAAGARAPRSSSSTA